MPVHHTNRQDLDLPPVCQGVQNGQRTRIVHVTSHIGVEDDPLGLLSGQILFHSPPCLV